MKKKFKSLIVSIAIISVFICLVGITVFAAGDMVNQQVKGVYPENMPYGINISWYSMKESTGYHVYRRCGDGKAIKIATIEDGETTEYYDSDVSSGKVYYYSVKAFNETEESKISAEKKRTFVSSARVSKPVVNNGSLTVSWSKVAGADEYRLYRKTENSSWSKIATLKADKLSYTDKNVKNDTVYYYSVVTLDRKVVSKLDENGTRGAYMETPSGFVLKNAYNGIRFSWKDISGVEEYRVYRKDTKNNKWERIAETINNTYFDDTVKNGTKYYYTVRAVGENGAVSQYKSSSVYMALFELQNVSVINKPTGVRISWKKASVGTGYKVFKLVDGSWKYIKAITSKNTTYYDDKTAVAGEYCTYMVRSYYSSSLGSFNPDGATIQYYPAPNLTVRLSSGGNVLKWNTTYGAEGYSIQHKVEGASGWSELKVVLPLRDTTFVHRYPTYGKKNYYRIVVLGVSSQTESFTRSVYGVNPNKKMVALTYDDGPHKTVTTRIVNTLKKYNGRATFFVVGNRVNSYKSAIKGAVNIGCEIGNHTYEHKILTSVSESTITSQINKTNSVVKSVCGVTPVIVRTPGGAINQKVKNTVKYPLVNWSVDTLDWKYRNATSVTKAVKGNVKDGSIILMHDLYESTATATETFVPWLVDNGYQLVTVSEMMQVKDKSFVAGKVYNNAY